jgi:general secretion pathway protein G
VIGTRRQGRTLTGFSLIELIITITVIAIIAGLAVPLARNAIRRQQEIELRRALREMRVAIDRHKEASDLGLIEVTVGTEGYPESLEILAEGVEQLNEVDMQLKFLREVPVDPITNSTNWGLRSYQDEPEARSWGGENVFDVYSQSDATALDGTRYSDW